MDAEGSQLIVGQRVSTCAADVGETEADLAAIPASLGKPTAALADCGYADKAIIERLSRERPGLDLYISVHREDAHAERRYDYRPLDKIKAPKVPTDPVLIAMAEKLRTPEGKARYRRRACTVEPVFGIIKSVLGFRQFLLRGLEKSAANGAWSAWPTTATASTVVLHSKQDKSVRSKQDSGRGWAMHEQDRRFFLGG